MDPVTGKCRGISRTFRGPPAAADTAFAALVAEVAGGKHAAGQSAFGGFATATTVGQLLDVWLESTVGRLSPTSVRDYQLSVDFINGKWPVAEERDPVSTGELQRLVGAYFSC
jgi:hypothetical protein